MYVNSFDLVSDKVIACFQRTDLCFMSAVVVVENYCVQAIHSVIVCHEDDKAIEELKHLRPGVRRRF